MPLKKDTDWVYTCKLIAIPATQLKQGAIKNSGRALFLQVF